MTNDPRSAALLKGKAAVTNPLRKALIEESVKNKEAMVTAHGALATWTRPESSGRSPKDTVSVKRQESEKEIDWDSPNNLPITEETFDLLLDDALRTLGHEEAALRHRPRPGRGSALRPPCADDLHARPDRPLHGQHVPADARRGRRRASSPASRSPSSLSPTTSSTRPATRGACASIRRRRRRRRWPSPSTSTGEWGSSTARPTAAR